MLLFTSGVTFFSAALAACAFKSGDAAGVRGSLSGWLGVVDVAVGDVGLVAETGEALWRADVVVRKRCDCRVADVGIRALEAARRQLRHIMFGRVGLQLVLGMSRSMTMSKSETETGSPELFLRSGSL